MTAPLLSVRNLSKHYVRKSGLFGGDKGVVRAVDGVSFDLFPGETLGLVGESGCGKTTTGRAILRLIEPTTGEVTFEGENVLELDAKSLRVLRRKMQIIFQDPFSSLDPRSRDAHARSAACGGRLGLFGLGTRIREEVKQCASVAP